MQLLLAIYKLYNRITADNRRLKTRRRRVNYKDRWKNDYRGWKNCKQKCYKHRSVTVHLETFQCAFEDIELSSVVWKNCQCA